MVKLNKQQASCPLSRHTVCLLFSLLLTATCLGIPHLETFQRTEDLFQGDRFAQDFMDGETQSDLFFGYQGDHNHRHLEVVSLSTERCHHLPADQVVQQQFHGNYIE